MKKATNELATELCFVGDPKASGMSSPADMPLAARKRGRKERKRRSGGVRPNRPNSAGRCMPVLSKWSRYTHTSPISI